MPSQNAYLISQLLGSAYRTTRLATRQAPALRGSTNYRVLGMLRQFENLRIGEIAAQEVISQPRATKIVADLEAGGLVARTTDPDDGRASVITITDAGRQAIDDRLEQLADLLEPRFTSLSEDDWAAVARTIELLEAAVDG